jgi:RNA-directed DNA polymerase
MHGITAFLEQRLKLKVNAEKSTVERPWKGRLLGYSMTWHKKPKLKIAPQSRE